jgi:hypothetical protein
MTSEGRALSVARRAVAAVLLLVVAGSMARTVALDEAARRWRLLRRAIAGERVPAGETTGFWFDSSYAGFLEEVRRRTPKDATIAIVVPSWPDVYVYQAAYQLAPRRVVEPGREGEAGFVAAYGYQGAPNASVIPIPGGALFRR